MNLYGFASGDPVNFADPFGLCPFGTTICGAWSSFLSWREAQGASCEKASNGACKPLIGVVPSWIGGPAGELEVIESRLGNITEELAQHDHFAAARLEASGTATRGDHIKELQNFANGLRNSAVRLKKMLGSDQLDVAGRERIEGLLSDVSKLRDQIMDALRNKP